MEYEEEIAIENLEKKIGKIQKKIDNKKKLIYEKKKCYGRIRR